MKKLLLVLLSVAMLFACDLGSDSDSKKEDEKKLTEPEVVTPEEVTISGGRGKALDKDGNLLGHILTMDDYEQTITIITDNGYILKILWDGSIVKDYIHYTGTKGAGTPFKYHYLKDTTDIPTVYEKTVIYGNNKFYIYETDAAGVVAKNTSITESLSRYSGYSDTIIEETSTFTSYYILFTLKAIDRTTIDYPMTVSQPISISFK